MEQGAAPAGAGLTWLCALGRLRGTARRALRPGREELADGWGIPHREARPGAGENAAVERREASALGIRCAQIAYTCLR
jgi:hypothetical protein